MRQTIGRMRIAAEMGDKPADFNRGARHQGAFQAVPFQAVKNAGRQPDDIFQRGADLIADKVRTVVKANKFALQILNQHVFGFFLIGVDNRAGWNLFI